MIFVQHRRLRVESLWAVVSGVSEVVVAVVGESDHAWLVVRRSVHQRNTVAIVSWRDTFGTLGILTESQPTAK